MEIRHLQYINEIVRRSSFTKAAEALHITQPTISKMIKNVENELNIELFNREGKQVKLTDAGEAIYRHAGPILQLFDNMMAEMNDLSYLHKGNIRIGLPPMAGSSFFPIVMKRFQERYPDITVEMVENGALKIEESVSDGSLDVGVVLSPINEQLFHSYPFVDERLNVIMHPSHSLAQQKQVTLSELAEDQFILFSNEFALHDRIIAECRLAGFEPNIVYESSQWDFIREMVAADLGVAMLPETICQTLDPDKVRVVTLINPIIPWQLAMVWRRESYLSLAAKAWIAFTQESFTTDKLK
ncbi:MAG: LysR family transcriptional regulator [Candidatus Pristimantibacillus sp.]